MSQGSLYDDLEVIREAAQLFAQRHAMLADPLLQAAETFWSVIHDDDVGDWPDSLRAHVTELAAELTRDGDVSARLEPLDTFNDDALIGRILELGKELEVAAAREAV